MPDRASKLGDRLSPVAKAALLAGLVAALVVGILVALAMNAAAGILVGVLVLIAVAIVAGLALETKGVPGWSPTEQPLDTTVVIEPIEPKSTDPEQPQT